MNPRCHAQQRHARCVRGFSLIELLVVIAIVSLLASLLLPVFMTARGAVRQAACASNLHQIGLGLSLYMQDSDGYYPQAIDPIDTKFWPFYDTQPEFRARIPFLPRLTHVMRPYTAPQVFLCPADTGIGKSDFFGVTLNAFPTSHEHYNTSYSYSTNITIHRLHEAQVREASQLYVMWDSAGAWHGSLMPAILRNNVLFGDGHIKNLTYDQLIDLRYRAWPDDPMLS